jgi:predicted lysophospholipase L1 biosynthesis ABC-type transport system permease subunit
VFLIVMSAVLALVGGLGLMTTMSLNVLERRREMGVLRAIGASPRMVWLIVVAEAVVVRPELGARGLVAWPSAGRWPIYWCGAVPHRTGVRLRAVGAAGVVLGLPAAGRGRQPASGVARVVLPGTGSDRLRVRRVRPCREDGRS